jgi:hypothetical protein
MQRKSFGNMQCPVARSLERVGEWWSILILRDAFAGMTRFDEFQKSLNIAPNILTRRLTALVDAGMLERRLYSDRTWARFSPGADFAADLGQQALRPRGSERDAGGCAHRDRGRTNSGRPRHRTTHHRRDPQERGRARRRSAGAEAARRAAQIFTGAIRFADSAQAGNNATHSQARAANAVQTEIIGLS